MSDSAAAGRGVRPPSARSALLGLVPSLVVEALVRIPLVYALSVSAGVVLADVLPFVVIAGLVTWTVLYAKRSAAASKAQAAALGSR